MRYYLGFFTLFDTIALSFMNTQKQQLDKANIILIGRETCNGLHKGKWKKAEKKRCNAM